jgi:hypothetical protein
MGPLPFDKLNESNYDDWKLQMEAYLESHDLFGVTDGTEDEPTTGENSKTMKAYRQKRRQARAKIILAVEPSQLPHTRETDPALIWENLAQIHRARGLGTLITMRRQFFSMTMPPNSTVAAWVASVRHAAYRLEECYRLELANTTTTTPPFTVSDLDKIMVLTAGLPPSYDPLVVNISSLPTLSISFENIVTRLLNEEGRHIAFRQVDTTPASTFVAPKPPRDPGVAALAQHSEKPGSRTGGMRQHPKTPNLAGVRCHKCGGLGHYRSQCPSPDVSSGTDPLCSNCRHGQANAVESPEETDDDLDIVPASYTAIGSW